MAFSGLASSVFISSIHSFWFGAVDVALRMAILPSPPARSEAIWIWMAAIPAETAWFTCTVRPPGAIAESQVTTGMPASIAALPTGTSASPSLAEIARPLTFWAISELSSWICCVASAVAEPW